MTYPRRLLAGRCYLVSRRCSERRFFLKPTVRALGIVRYGLARAASATRIRIHGFVVSSNHLHVHCTDPDGRQLPRFMHRLGSLLGRALNAHLGRGESFWAPGSYSAVELLDPAAVLEKLVYVLVNVCKDGLVRRPEHWKGLRSGPRDVGFEVRASRPEFFFRQEGPGCLPEVCAFRLMVPPGFEHLSEAQFCELLERRVNEELERIRAERRRAGRTRVIGMRAIMAESPHARAGGTFPERVRDPRVACRDPEARKAALVELSLWRISYRQAWLEWVAGNHEVVFPAGTYWMHLAHGAVIRAGPAPPRAA